ncbi:NAD(P)/FAD-dependent oxidoreductase [Actinomadura latina]|uniref:NAD(P)/FAD-dependent oxidoreductase n=1 Tax=Actinomadura latina TaxID=163603 RepID=A0A846ZE75_9ACTN|nr:NAD(P)/FAD-dependent oxidoreductase [Actinomadura latina]NKZ08903.1 NAD(P)/FAD-dependent oxidoreductase [Actinomadura latina]
MASETYDAVIVGARCAGASAALLLARQGRRVLLIDRMGFPSDVMSTLYIHPPGTALLARWGLLDAVAASGCPPLDTVSYDVAGLRLTASTPSTPYSTVTYAPRRHVLDDLLVRAAIDAGADFADRTGLREVVRRDDRVTGVRIQTPGGLESVPARLVIGADGRGSRLASLVDAPFRRVDDLASCVYYSCWQGVRSGFGYHERPDSWIARIPTHDGVTMVATYFPQDRFQRIRRDPAAAHLESIERNAPDLHEQLAGAERVERLSGTGDQQNFFRRPHGPGWALIGDAGHHLDSITARGITNALTQAQLISDALAGQDLDDASGTDTRLAGFAKETYDLLSEPYQMALDLAKLRLTESRAALLRAIAGAPGLADRYFAMIAGVIDRSEFFTPEVVDLLPASASWTSPHP